MKKLIFRAVIYSFAAYGAATFYIKMQESKATSTVNDVVD